MTDGHLNRLKADYDQLGYVISPALLSSELTVEMIELIETVQSGIADLSPQHLNLLVLERDLPASKRGGIAAGEVGDAIFILGDPPAFDRRFTAAIVAPAAVELAQHLLGASDIRYHFSNITMKRERVGSGISWHRDYPNAYMCPETSSFVRLMICLDGMDPGNGATRFVVGSQRILDSEARWARRARRQTLLRPLSPAQSARPALSSPSIQKSCMEGRPMDRRAPGGTWSSSGAGQVIPSRTGTEATERKL
jgi:Phytanoyl-CoA dioxygenase (PhyH)